MRGAVGGSCRHGGGAAALGSSACLTRTDDERGGGARDEEGDREERERESAQQAKREPSASWSQWSRIPPPPSRAARCVQRRHSFLSREQTTEQGNRAMLRERKSGTVPGQWASAERRLGSRKAPLASLSLSLSPSRAPSTQSLAIRIHAHQARQPSLPPLSYLPSPHLALTLRLSLRFFTSFSFASLVACIGRAILRRLHDLPVPVISARDTHEHNATRLLRQTEKACCDWRRLHPRTSPPSLG